MFISRNGIEPSESTMYYNWATSRENLSSEFSTRLDSNRSAQLQKLARGMKLQI